MTTHHFEIREITLYVANLREKYLSVMNEKNQTNA